MSKTKAAKTVTPWHNAQGSCQPVLLLHFSYPDLVPQSLTSFRSGSGSGPVGLRISRAQLDLQLRNRN